MWLLRKRILPALTILLVMCAQVFGMQRGFVCDHQGVQIETVAEHCHLVVVDGQRDHEPCSSGNDCGDQEGTEHHSPFIVELQTNAKGLTTVSVPVFAAVLLTEITVHQWKPVQTLPVNEFMKAAPTNGDKSPPAALQVARCTVILI